MTTSVDPLVRKIVTRAVRKGIVTPAEGAAFAGVTRQAVQKWVGTGAEARRARYATVTLRKMMGGDRRPSRAEMRREAAEAVTACAPAPPP